MIRLMRASLLTLPLRAATNQMAKSHGDRERQKKLVRITDVASVVITLRGCYCHYICSEV